MSILFYPPIFQIFPYSFYNSIICESVNELKILYLWGNIQKYSFCAKINNLYLVVGRAIA